MIRVVSPGLFTTVQDLGRPGYAHLGISAAGAADSLALRIGNRLVGNDEGAPALEMTLAGGSFQFGEDAVCAITGGECGDAPAWVPFAVRAGEAVRVRATRGGARHYLCVRGGIAAEPVLGSASVHAMSGLGRPVRSGDEFAIGDAVTSEPVWGGLLWRPVQDFRLRVTDGPQAGWFSEGIPEDQAFVVGEESDRMGVRLSGTPLLLRCERQMLTEGVSLGAVQVPPSGQPIILFVDHQTTGGYPKIGNVILADLWKVGQLRPRERVRFVKVSLDEALSALREQERRIGAVQ